MNFLHEKPVYSQANTNGLARKRSIAALVFLVVGGGSAVYVNTRPKPRPTVNVPTVAEIPEQPLPEAPMVFFRDVTHDVGVSFKHHNGATGEKLLPEAMGGGCAAFDFDNDNDPDLLLVDSMNWPNGEPSRGTTKLYRNDGGRFVDVTVGSGLDVTMYGMGVAVGDFDNDGLVDVFISAVGPNALFRNLGGGKFENVTESAGVAGSDSSWSSSTGWVDFDNDGDLDLFVCNYVEWNREHDLAQTFQLTENGRSYSNPQSFAGTYPYMYRNDGNGKFTDVSETAGVQIKHAETGVPLAKALGITFCDLDEDRNIDILVANDTVQNLLLKNMGNGTFTDLGVLSGIAFDLMGDARGGMGIDVTPFRGSEAMVISIGNYAYQATSFYIADRGSTQFVDEAWSLGLGASTRMDVTFGLFFFDYDLDGRPDLFSCNGHVQEEINQVYPDQNYEQASQLYWNSGLENEQMFVQVDDSHGGPDMRVPMIGRGAMYTDFDSDGDLDVVVTTAGREARVLRNELDLGHHWLRIKLKGDGKHCNRDAIGSWVEVRLGDQTLRQQVMPTRSYLSQVELPVTFGLGDAEKIDSVNIHWSDGETQEIGPLAVDQLHVIERR
jgi:enediyne biosynthesis protein E4